MSAPVFRKLHTSDRSWINEFIKENWGSGIIVVREKCYIPAELQGFCAEMQEEKIGLITYKFENDECEIVSLDSKLEKIGIGTKLISLVIEEAKKNNCTKIKLITTNDNIEAISFYKNRGFSLVQIYPNSMAANRLIKKEIPLIGNNGIPIKDEIEFELKL